MGLDIFNKEISIYRNKYDTCGMVGRLRDFLFNNEHFSEIEYLRTIEDKDKRKELKMRLPQAAVSGVFDKRSKNGLRQHSGLICIDIDGKDNPGINIEQTKKELSTIKEIAYVSISVGGAGLFCIVPIAYPNMHEEHFLSLQDDFKHIGLNIDPACKDVSRLRCISYDPTPVTNPNAEEYFYLKEKPKPILRKKVFDKNDGDIEKVYSLCRLIEAGSIDITGGYYDWFRIGAALASLGENGREAFHMVSRQSEKYNQRECDRQFDHCLQRSGLIGIGTFFMYCKNNGIKL